MSKGIQSQQKQWEGIDNCRVKWLIYNAASPVAFAESIVASHKSTREDETQKQIHTDGQHDKIIRKTEKHLQYSCECTFHIQISLTRGYQR